MISLFKDLASLVFPPLCPACGRLMTAGQGIVCTSCQWEMPLTGFEREADNPVARRFWGLVPIQNATSFVWFADRSGFRRVVHAFKYGGRWSLARDMGLWFGRVLAETDAYSAIDLVVPVPLHLHKRLKRGYNQSEYIARGIARSVSRPVVTGAVVRRVNNPSQTSLDGHHQRWSNVEGIFAVRRPGLLAGRHILLVDDVLTTGATIASCAQSIVTALPDCRLSIATLCASRHHLGIKD